jgi:hypothetical protein
LSTDIFDKKSDTINLTAQLSIIKQRYQKETDALSGSNKKYTSEIYKQCFENIKSMFDKGELENNTQANEYFQTIVSKIIKANPQLAALDLNGYVSKSTVPNAHSIGYGVFVVNAGIICKLSNESQLAYVIAHELSHIYLHHLEKGIDKYITSLYSEETQNELKNIKKQEFRKREALEKLAKGFVFDNRRHSRGHEKEADSLAIVFLTNTDFQLKETLSTLGSFDTIDNPNCRLDQILSQTFNCPEYPFKNKWLSKEDGLLGGHANLENDDKELKDSLKTHPDCHIRIKALEATIAQNENANRKQNPIDLSKFNALKKWLPYESLDYYYKNKGYCEQLFLALQLIKTEKDDEKIVLSIGSAFNDLVAAQKKHQIGKVTELPAPYNNDDYNTLLQFINNLYSDEMASINYYFLKKYQQQLANDKQFQSVLLISKQNL